jgi:hypothetical protein
MANNGKRTRTPIQLERQLKVFNLHIEGKTHREIMKILGIADTGTIVNDIRQEAELRAAERSEMREADQAAHLARIDELIASCRNRFDKQGTSALPTAAKALEMRAKILGLDAPLKVDMGMAELVKAIIAEPDDPSRPLS